MVLQRSWSSAQGMGGLHSDHQRAHQDRPLARESSQEELLGVWSACTQVQNGEVLFDSKLIFATGNIFQDNEFELVFVIGYQKMLPLNYLDKLLDEIQLR